MHQIKRTNILVWIILKTFLAVVPITLLLYFGGHMRLTFWHVFSVVVLFGFTFYSFYRSAALQEISDDENDRDDDDDRGGRDDDDNNDDGGGGDLFSDEDDEDDVISPHHGTIVVEGIVL